jgi:hypothetical protein
VSTVIGAVIVTSRSCAMIVAVVSAGLSPGVA